LTMNVVRHMQRIVKYIISHAITHNMKQTPTSSTLNQKEKIIFRNKRERE
jgi:hypothetical protein